MNAPASSAPPHPDHDAFVWPPAAADEPIGHDAPVDPETELGSVPPEGWLERLESDLLGVRSVGFAHWARRTGWRPDPPHAFCWRCAGSVGPHEIDGSGCAACRTRRLAWDRAARLGVYSGGVRAGVLELKFARWRRSGRDLGRAMGDRLREVLEGGGFAPGEVVLVPVPTSWRRRMARGVDHTLVLARAAGARAGVRVVRGLGRRHTPPQVGLSATARAANIRGAFKPRKPLACLGEGVRAVVVLDDVRTTGATLTAACRAVRGAVGKGREVWVLTAAVASDRPSDRAKGDIAGSEREKIAKSFDPLV